MALICIPFPTARCNRVGVKKIVGRIPEAFDSLGVHQINRIWKGARARLIGTVLKTVGLVNNKSRGFKSHPFLHHIKALRNRGRVWLMALHWKCSRLRKGFRRFKSCRFRQFLRKRGRVWFITPAR